MDMLKKVGHWFAPPPDKSDDGRDVWPSRAAFLLASMGGCAGMGNLLRYPSQVYNNYGVQWFIPYLCAVFFLAIPVLVLEISIGQAYRGGSVVAFNNINRRLKGVGLSLLYIGFIVGPYFVVNLAWIMAYFRYSFQDPLPWTGRTTEFYDQVVGNPKPIAGNLTADGKGVQDYTQYPGVGMVGETVGWCAFTWFLVWLCIFRGVGLTGRVVYWTMGLPVVVTIILVGRSCSLPNAGEGIKLYWGTWRGAELAKGSLWQTACGQVFFSTGVGFGYFTSYASYNRKHSNAVMDSFLIVGSNVLFEGFAAFAIFGIVGFLGMHPDPADPVGGFTIGFLTLPAAVTEMPGANFWAIAVFFTLMVLGFSSAFAMLDAVVTLAMDSGTKLSRPIVVTSLTILSFLLSLPYCTEFGYYLLSGIDKWISDVALVFVVFAEAVSATTLYRWRDVAGQVGLPSLALYNFGYLGGMVVGVATGLGVGIAEAGAGAGFGLFIVCTIASCLIAKTPDTGVPKLFAKSPITQRFYYLAFYSGHALTKDLNVIVGTGSNWSLPTFWAPFLRYISGPILAIVYGFSYPTFHQVQVDPLHIMGFITAHVVLVIMILGAIVPRWLDVLIPPNRRDEAKVPYAPGVTIGTTDGQEANTAENGAVAREDSADNASSEVKKETVTDNKGTREVS